MFQKSALHTSRVALLILLSALAVQPAAAQSVDAKPVDLRFTVVNATTGQPASLTRLTIDYVRERRNGLLDFTPSGANFVAPSIPVKDGGEYLVTAWYQDVPYWWSLRGRQLIEQTTTLHVFDTTDQTDGASLQGLNLVIRRQGALLKLEYMLQVDNPVKPQQTVFDERNTFALYLPDGATQIVATYRRGPDPTPIPFNREGNRLGLAAPLTPGLTHIQISAVVPWREDMDFPVGSSLPVTAWSLLVSPEWLEVVGQELQPSESAVPGFNRLTGPALTAGRTLNLRLRSGEEGPGAEEDLFTQGLPTPTNATPPVTEDESGSSAPPLPFLIGGALIIIVIIVASRRRR